MTIGMEIDKSIVILVYSPWVVINVGIGLNLKAKEEKPTEKTTKYINVTLIYIKVGTEYYSTVLQSMSLIFWRRTVGNDIDMVYIVDSILYTFAVIIYSICF